MNLNLNDVNSIVTWWQVHPECHSSYLGWKLSVSGEFAPAIREAQRRIASPEAAPAADECREQPAGASGS